MNLVIDLGQSGSRYKFDTSSEIVSLDVAKTSKETVLATLEKIFLQIPKAHSPKVFLSLTGLQGDVGDPNPYGELCSQFFQSNEVAVMDDGIAAYVGALGDSAGVALTLGGGVVAVSNIGNRFGHADGKGPIFGDYGGGFWLGQTALRRAIATTEGRDDSFDLVSLMDKELEVHNSLKNKTGVEASQLCIKAAQTVAYGAGQGNESARAILVEGANYLGKTINAAWLKVVRDEKPIPTISILGGLAKSEIYVGLIRSEVAKYLEFNFAQPNGDHLVGAPIAAERFADGVHPLLKWWRS